MWQTLSSNLYGNFVYLACCRKAVLFKMSSRNATVIVSSWVTSQWQDNWDNVKKTTPTPFSQPSDLPNHHWYSWLSPPTTALFSLFNSVQTFWPGSQILLGALLCTSYARALDLFWIHPDPGKSAFCALSPLHLICLAPYEQDSVTSAFVSFLPVPISKGHMGTLRNIILSLSFLPPISQLPLGVDVSSQRLIPILHLWVECTLCLASGTLNHQKEPWKHYWSKTTQMPLCSEQEHVGVVCLH